MRKASKLGIKTGWGEDAGGERIDLGFEKPGGTENERNTELFFLLMFTHFLKMLLEEIKIILLKNI